MNVRTVSGGSGIMVTDQYESESVFHDRHADFIVLSQSRRWIRPFSIPQVGEITIQYNTRVFKACQDPI